MARSSLQNSLVYPRCRQLLQVLPNIMSCMLLSVGLAIRPKNRESFSRTLQPNAEQ